jgi:O-antigen ligase
MSLSQSKSAPLLLDNRSARLRQFGWIGLLAVGAVILGWSIASEQWMLLIGAVAVPLLALWPVQLAFGVYAFLVPFDGVGVIGSVKGGPAITFVAGAVAGAVLLVTGYLRHRLERPTPTMVWWSLFVAWAALSTLWAIDPDRALLYLPTALGLLFLYLVTASLRMTHDEFSWIVLAIILGGCAAAAYSTRAYYSGVLYHNSVTAGRSSLIIGDSETDPNVFAASLFLPLSLAVGRFLDSRGWHRMLYVVMAGLIALGVVLTMSRGALLALGVMVVVYVRRLGVDRRVIVPVLIVLVALVALPSNFMTRVETARSSGGAGRLYIWEVGLASLQRYGLFGAGFRNFSKAYTEYVGEGSQVYSYGESAAHNIYLETIVEFGIVGFTFMAMAIFTAIRAGKRVRNQKKVQPGFSMTPYEAAVWAMLTASFFVGLSWGKSFWLVWIMYALVLRIANEKAKQPAPVGRQSIKSTGRPAFGWNQ